MNWLKWLIIFGIAAIAIWLMSGKKDIKTLIKSKSDDEKEPIDAEEIAKKIRDKMRKNQTIIRLK